MEIDVASSFAELSVSCMLAPDALDGTSSSLSVVLYPLQVGARSAGQYVQGLCEATAAVAGGKARCQLVDDSGGEEADEADGEEARRCCPIPTWGFMLLCLR